MGHIMDNTFNDIHALELEFIHTMVRLISKLQFNMGQSMSSIVESDYVQQIKHTTTVNNLL